MSIDRGVCPKSGKARFTHDEAEHKVANAKRRGQALALYRCPVPDCGGWWHVAHAAERDGHGGGIRREKKRKPTRRITRARHL